LRELVESKDAVYILNLAGGLYKLFFVSGAYDEIIEEK
jgi:hypothetical protein